MKRKCFKAIGAMLVLGGLLTGCGSSGNSKYADSTPTVHNSSVQESEMDYDLDMDYSSGIAESESPVPEPEAAFDVSVNDDSSDSGSSAPKADDIVLLEEKLVYYCDLNIETLDYAATIASIRENIAKYDGIIQSEVENDSSRNWYYSDYRKTGGTMSSYLQVRIPSANYESFLSELNGAGRITSKSKSVDNISQEYYDTATQIEALQIQERNLLKMFDECETIEDMITVESRLSEIQYQLNALQTHRRYMDMDVAYSYVNINVTEVMEYHYDEAPVRKNKFIDRLGNTIKATGKGFLAFLEGLLFLAIRLFPYIIIAGIVCLIFRKRISRFLADRKAYKAAVRAQKQMRREPVNGGSENEQIYHQKDGEPR